MMSLHSTRVEHKQICVTSDNWKDTEMSSCSRSHKKLRIECMFVADFQDEIATRYLTELTDEYHKTA